MDIAETLQRSTCLVKAWGQSQLPSGKTLAAALTLDGVPFWDAFAVDVARLHVPAALAAESPSSSPVRRIRPYLSRAKHWVRDLVTHRRSVAACSAWPSGPTVLCLGFSNYLYRDVLHPVAEQLAEHGPASVVSLGDQHWPELIANDNGVRLQTIWQHWDREVGRDAVGLQRSLRAVEAELRAPCALPEILRDGEQSLWDRLRSAFDWFFRVHVPLLIPQAAVARHILEKHAPVAVISCDVADPRTRVYTLLCQRMRIPSLEVQTGPIGTVGVEMEWAFMAADCVAAWGETSRTAMQVYGVPAEHIVMTGSARHDRLVNVPEAEVRARRAQLGVPEGSAMVVFASGYRLKTYDAYSDLDLFRSMQRAVFEAADRTPAICVVVKPHPLEDGSETRALAGTCRNVVFVDRQSDIRELTRVCDGFVSFGSTATADALVARKMAMCLEFPGWMWNDLFQQSGAAVALRSPEEVAKAFQSIATGAHKSVLAALEPARQRFLEQWVFRADGQAAQRIVRLACQMAGLEA